MSSPGSNFHSGWMFHKGEKDKDYRRVFGVLKNFQLHLFTCDYPRVQETHVGGYDIYPGALIKEEKKDKSHATFSFHTFRTRKDGNKVKVTAKFKVDGVGERMLWMAYILGIADGQIPQELQDKLIPGQKRDVLDAIGKVWNHRDTDSGINIDLPQSPSGSISQPPDLPPRNGRKTSTSYNSGSDTSGSTGKSSPNHSGSSLPRPAVYASHRFYREQDRNLETPSWFFKCARPEAECALINGKKYGACLIRPSSNRDQNVPYTVSYCSENRVHHLKIARQSGLFVLPDVPDVGNSFNCLHDIMCYIKDRNPTLVPMRTNNMSILGVREESDYDTFLPQKPPLLPPNPIKGHQELPPTDYDQETYDDVSVGSENIQQALDILDNAYGEIDDRDLDDQIYNKLSDEEDPFPPPPPPLVSPKRVTFQKTGRSMSTPDINFHKSNARVPPLPKANNKGTRTTSVHGSNSGKDLADVLKERFTKLEMSGQQGSCNQAEDFGGEYDDICLPKNDLQKALQQRRNVIHDVEDYEMPDEFAPIQSKTLPARGRKQSAPSILSPDHIYDDGQSDSNRNKFGKSGGATGPRGQKQLAPSLSFEEELKSKLENRFIYSST